jgi:hypothetical protein
MPEAHIALINMGDPYIFLRILKMMPTARHSVLFLVLGTGKDG